MIVGLGTDIVSISRIEALMVRFKEKFITRIFTENEITKAQHLETLAAQSAYFAKRFAAKEAFSKALGLGIGRGVDFIDIEISNDDLGQPHIAIINSKMPFVLNHFRCPTVNIHLSISDEKFTHHDGDESTGHAIANAVVIIEKVL